MIGRRTKGCSAWCRAFGVMPGWHHMMPTSSQVRVSAKNLVSVGMGATRLHSMAMLMPSLAWGNAKEDVERKPDSSSGGR